jgi:DNA-binding NtrC family response regulator
MHDNDLQILFVDDDSDILSMVDQYLSIQGYQIHTADNGFDALELIRENRIDVVFTDFKMPEFNGLELLVAVKKANPETEVIIVTGYGSMESAIKAMKFGSYDYLQKPFKLDHLKLIIDRIGEEKKIQARTKLIRQRSKERHRYGKLVGLSPKMQEIYALIDTICLDTSTVLIQGEKGTGKALLARTIHERSDRSDNPFVVVHCGNISESTDSKDGNIDEHIDGIVKTAVGGTLYLDEMADMTEPFRERLILSLEEVNREVPNMAGLTNSGNAVRIIAATTKEIDDVVKSGVLRTRPLDLLQALLIRIPPLRERREDICLLINEFIHINPAHKGKTGFGIAPQALDLLLDYHWPGNLDQLKDLVERAFERDVRELLLPKDLPPEIQNFKKSP